MSTRLGISLALGALGLLVTAGCADPIGLGAPGTGGSGGSGGSGGTIDGGPGGMGGNGASGGGGGTSCTETGCSDGNPCTVDGVCNTVTGACVGGGENEPIDSPCAQDGGFFCDGEGSCVVCNDDAQCSRFFPPQECREAAACVDHACPIPAALPDGSPCSEGQCFLGTCVAAPPQSKRIPMVCDNSNSDFLWEIPIDLTVAPDAVEATHEVSADIRATLLIPQEFLQFALDAVFPAELTTFEIDAAQAEIVTDGVLSGSPVSTRLNGTPVIVAIPQMSDPSAPQGPNLATDEILIELAPIFNAKYRAEASGAVCFDAGGANPPSTIGAPPVRTGIRALASNGAFVRFECVGGTLDDNGTPTNPFDDFIEPNVPEAQICFPIETPEIDRCEGPPPVSCSADDQCVTEAVCDPFDGQCTGGTNEPRGTPCDQDGGSLCDGQGACVQCIEDAGCVDDGNECTTGANCDGDRCVPATNLPQGTVCDQDGGDRCDGDGNCILVGDGPFPQTESLTLGCTTNLSEEVSIVPFELTVAPEAVTSGQPFAAELSGAGTVPEALLDAVQWVIPGGVTRIDLIDLRATVRVRAGATGNEVPLAAASIPYRCAVGDGACDPMNDEEGTPGKRGNSDCLPVGPSNPCGRFIDIPTSDDCDVGGACAALDGGSGAKLDQCGANGFCVTGALDLPLESSVGTYTAAAVGPVLFGWDDAGTGATLDVDGTWDLPLAVFSNPIVSNGIRLGVDALSVALECTMGVDSNGSDGVGIAGQSSPTPDARLISFSIQAP